MKKLIAVTLFLGSCGVTFAQQAEVKKESADSIYVKKPCLPTIGKEVPLYILDDVQICAEDIDNINSATIDTVTVLKYASDTEPYGEKGKNGVIIIQTKKQKKDPGKQ
jgi:hypothetical protein